MAKAKNILFIMCDQLRWDYLSCYGHPHLQTPHIDSLAERGVRFNRAYVQAPVCGPSRMCFYTGRYMSCHGSTYNQIPLRVGEPTMGDYLRPQGMRTVLVGKTHMAADIEGMNRLGLVPESEAGVYIRECGFEPFERDDGLHLDHRVRADLAYNQYLRGLGYDTKNPWHDHANSALDEAGHRLSGWYLRNASKPANIKEEHSETPYMTGRAIDFIQNAGDAPWCVHLSYIKPHWPYIAPAPYHNIYGPEHLSSPNRSEAERENPHPVYKAFMERLPSLTFTRDDVRETVIPAYMGLIKQIDDQVGRLLTFLEREGYLDDTFIVFTSDHGDYLGDHWLGEKDYFHEETIRIPLIIYDPSPEADGVRGAATDHFVEAIDLAPTFLEVAGGEPQPHRLEGHSLIPLLHDKPVTDWRSYVICETDYGCLDVRHRLNVPPADSRAYMIRTAEWKYILHELFPSQLYDLTNDPLEHQDLGLDPAYASIREGLHEEIFRWLRRRKMRLTYPDQAMQAQSEPGALERAGFIIGHW